MGVNKNISEMKTRREVDCRKRVIIVAGPVCSGKTTVAKNLARNISQPFYLDKDELVYCTYPIFHFAGQPVDRHSDFFDENIRDVEYVSANKLALAGLQYNDTVIINAPYSDELRKTSGKRFDLFQEFGDKIHAMGAELIVICLVISPEVMKTRLQHRLAVDGAAQKRDNELNDPEKMEKFCRAKAQPAPELPDNSVIDRMFVFDSDDAPGSFGKLMAALGIVDAKPFEATIK